MTTRNSQERTISSSPVYMILILVSYINPVHVMFFVGKSLQLALNHSLLIRLASC
jgi:hypothetical protein